MRLEEIIEIVESLAQLPDGDTCPQLLSQLQPQLTLHLQLCIAVLRANGTDQHPYQISG